MDIVVAQCLEQTAVLETFARHLASRGCSTNIIAYCKCGDSRAGELMRLADGTPLCTHHVPNVGRDGHTYLHHIASARGRFAPHTLFFNGGAVSKGWLRSRSWRMLAAFLDREGGVDYADCGGFVSAAAADLDDLPLTLRPINRSARTAPPLFRRLPRSADATGAGAAAVEATPSPAEAFVSQLAARCADDPRTGNQGWGSAATGLGRLWSPGAGNPCCEAWCGPVECCPAFGVVCPAGENFLWNEQRKCSWRGGTTENYHHQPRDLSVNGDRDASSEEAGGAQEGVGKGVGLREDDEGYQSSLEPVDPPNFLLWAEREWGVSPEARWDSGSRQLRYQVA